MKRLSLVGLVLLVGGTARADFILIDNQHLEVSSVHSVGVLYDSSTADVVSGGVITTAYVNDEALLQVLGGYVGSGGSLSVYNAGKVHIATGGWVYGLSAYDTGDIHITGGNVYGNFKASDTSTVDISGGSIPVLQAKDNSIVNISGGTIQSLGTRNTSTVNILGGTFPSRSLFNDASIVNISGGTFSSRDPFSTLYVRHTSTANISGGTFSRNLEVCEGGNLNVSNTKFTSLQASGSSTVSISDSNFDTLDVSGNSVVDIFSGSNFDSLEAFNTSCVTFHGYDFRTLGGLRLEDEMVIGSTGILTGKWFDGTPWLVSIPTHHASATIRVIAEPSTFALLVIGVFCIPLFRRWCKRLH